MASDFVWDVAVRELLTLYGHVTAGCVKRLTYDEEINASCKRQESNSPAKVTDVKHESPASMRPSASTAQRMTQYRELLRIT